MFWYDSSGAAAANGLHPFLAIECCACGLRVLTVWALKRQPSDLLLHRSLFADLQASLLTT
jgi:hypothetical protein